MTAHAKLSPSSAHRWTLCPGSINAENNLPAHHKVSDSIYAQEGTIAHELAETCLNGNITPFNMTDNKDMAHYVQEYIDYINSFSGITHIEVRVKLDRWIANSFGTSDCVIEDGSTLRVIDLKYGMGKKVYAKNNLQGVLYALGSLDTFNAESITDICIAIVQPRLDHIDEWTISKAKLLKIGNWIKDKAVLTEDPNAPRVPGDSQCQWCKAKPVCPTLKAHTDKITLSAFEDTNLSIDEIATVLEQAPLIRAWLTSVEEYATTELKHNQPVPGYKLVMGRGSRTFTESPEAMAAILENLNIEPFEKKLKTPAKVEKELKKDKDKIQDYIKSIEGKPVLAKESDKRKKIQNTIDSFNIID